MKCVHCKENIWAYLEGTLSQDMAQEVEKHLLVCVDCKEEADLVKDMMQALHTLPNVELPEGYHAELMQKIEKEANTNNVVPFPKNKKTNWKNMGLVAAALLVVAVAGGIQGIQRMKQPQDAVIAQMEQPIQSVQQDIVQPQTFAIEETKQMPKAVNMASDDEQVSSSRQLLTNRSNIQQPETVYATLSVEDTQKAIDAVNMVAKNLSLEVTTEENQVTVSMQYKQMADFYKKLKDVGSLTIEAEVLENTEQEAVVLVQITCKQK